MQIQQRVLRVAAAASVTLFLAVGAVGPVYATGSETGTTKARAASSGDHKAGKKHADDTTEPQPESTADQNDGGANAGDCDESTETTTTSDDQAAESDETADSQESADSDESDTNNYCSTRDGSPSQNGEGDGKATGKPCAGCVGKADNKNPKGQAPDGSDANNGYECDGNKGIGKSNPAHTGCTPGSVSPDEEQPGETCAADEQMSDEAGEDEDCVPPTTEGGSTPSGEVLGVEAERAPAANRAAADVAPASSGLLPETGAGRYGIPIGLGLALLGTGGVLLLRRRPQASR
jgi:LPXTG-motif cell wall-anchored protein